MGNAATSCCICLEKKNKGFLCNSGHFTCKNCFSPYITSICENAGKLCDNGFLIRCPDPTCRSNPWTVAQLRTNLDGDVMDFYVNALIRFSSKIAAGEAVDDIKKDSLVKRVTAALSISCPKCKSVLDQNPEGCCAIRCDICACHFCWLCFQTQTDSAACHRHVATCKMNPSHDLFAPVNVREVAHKTHRIRNIQVILKDSHRDGAAATNGTNLTVDWTQNPAIITALNEIRPLLAQSEITPEEILITEQNVEMYYFKNMLNRAIQPIITQFEHAFKQFRATQTGIKVLHYLSTVYLEFTRVWNILVPKHEIIQFVAKYILVTIVWKVVSFVFGMLFGHYNDSSSVNNSSVNNSYSSSSVNSINNINVNNNLSYHNNDTAIVDTTSSSFPIDLYFLLLIGCIICFHTQGHFPNFAIQISFKNLEILLKICLIYIVARGMFIVLSGHLYLALVMVITVGLYVQCGVLFRADVVARRAQVRAQQARRN